MVKSLYQIIGAVVIVISSTSFHDNLAQTVQKHFPLPEDLRTIRESDLEPLIKLIGNARIIATTEADHGMNEPLDFRNALIKLLVRKKIIDVVIIESGITESRLLYQYVLGANVEGIDEVLYNGLSWQFHVLPQNEEIVEWLRAYNSDSKNSHKVKLYGFDMPGSPTNHVVHRKMNTALIAALDYLKTVDPVAYAEFSNKLLPYSPYLHVNFTSHDAAEKQYIDLTATQREELNRHVQELIQYLEVNEIMFTGKSSAEDYEWSYQAAVNTRHTINLANYIPLDYKIVSSEELESSDLIRKIIRYRDRVMVDNIEWILDREPGSKVLLFAGTNHLLKIPIDIKLDSMTTYRQECAGNYLSHRYKDEYIVIGNMVASENEKFRIENRLIDDQSSHYYMKIPTKENSFLREEIKYLNYRSKNKKLDLLNAVDVILFNRRQTAVTFRGN